MSRDLLARLAHAKLDIGCGPAKRGPDWIGIDSRELPGVDVVGDAAEVLRLIGDGAVAHAYASHFLEHVDDVTGLLRELARVMEPGGAVELVVPHFSNPYGHSDLTHRHVFGLYSMSYLVPGGPFRRRVPQYEVALPFRLEAVRLEFRAPSEFAVRARLRPLLTSVFNASTWLQELYEENLCYLLPCFQIRFLLRRDLESARAAS